MPPVSINRKKYMARDLNRLIKNLMRENKISQINMAALLGISQSHFSKKLKTNDFNWQQLVLIFETIGASGEEILNVMKVQKGN